MISLWHFLLMNFNSRRVLSEGKGTDDQKSTGFKAREHT
jgi:hypothetical protein